MTRRLTEAVSPSNMIAVLVLILPKVFLSSKLVELVCNLTGKLDTAS